MILEDLDVKFKNEQYVVDSNKMLYKKNGDNYIPLIRIKKHIYKMALNNGLTYFIDNFGDCFLIQENCVFMFGIICKPVFWDIFNGDFITADSYKRIWIHEISGKIKNILFFEKNIEKIVLNGNKFSVYLSGSNSNPINYNIYYKTI